MTKKEQQRYDKTIEEIAESLTMDAWKKANDITEGVYLDILMRMRSMIDVKIGYIQERNKEKLK